MRFSLTIDRRLGSLLTAMVVGLPLAFAGGGGVDNDSPFGAPKNSNGAPNGPPAFADSGEQTTYHALPVSLGFGASLDFGSVAALAAQLEILGDVMIEGDPDHEVVAADPGAFDDLAVGGHVSVPAGESARATRTSDGYAVQGHVTVEGDVRLILRASEKSEHHAAFLAIGEVAPAGFVAEHVLQIPLADGGVDVTALRAAIAPYEAVLAGKVARIHLFGLTMQVAQGLKITHEAMATFEVGSAVTDVEVNGG